MIVRAKAAPRRGTLAVEMAVLAPVLVLFIFGLIVVGLGVFRYNQTAYLAREAARFAAVRGDDWARETKKPAATQESVTQDVVLAKAAGLTPALLTTTVVWDGGTDKSALLVSKTTGAATGNYVTVTVSYLWQPEIPLIPAMTLTSTSRLPVAQ